MYKGAIILESLDNPEVIQLLSLSKVMKPTKYYAHFWNDNIDVIAVFRDKIFEFNFDDKKSWEPAIEYGLSVNIPREQLNFLIN